MTVRVRDAIPRSLPWRRPGRGIGVPQGQGAGLSPRTGLPGCFVAAHARTRTVRRGIRAWRSWPRGRVCRSWPSKKSSPHKVRYYLEQRDP